jgi:hypothetical protein
VLNLTGVAGRALGGSGEGIRVGRVARPDGHYAGGPWGHGDAGMPPRSCEHPRGGRAFSAFATGPVTAHCRHGAIDLAGRSPLGYRATPGRHGPPPRTVLSELPHLEIFGTP